MNSLASKQKNWLRDFTRGLDEMSDLDLRKTAGSLTLMLRSVHKEIFERLQLLTDKELKKEKRHAR